MTQVNNNNNNNNNKYKMEDNQQPHLRYVAAVQQPHTDGLFVEASCCVGEGDDREPIERFARYKLRAINEVNVLCAHRAMKSSNCHLIYSPQCFIFLFITARTRTSIVSSSTTWDAGMSKALTESLI